MTDSNPVNLCDVCNPVQMAVAPRYSVSFEVGVRKGTRQILQSLGQYRATYPSEQQVLSLMLTLHPGKTWEGQAASTIFLTGVNNTSDAVNIALQIDQLINPGSATEHIETYTLPVKKIVLLDSPVAGFRVINTGTEVANFQLTYTVD